MDPLADFQAILTPGAPLGKMTCFRVGGPAQWLARPRNLEELARLTRRLRDAEIPSRILGGGYNLLVPDEGVQGVVLRLDAEEFQRIKVEGTRVHAGAGASLPDLIAAACKASAAGLEGLVGIPGSVGGALERNVGDRGGDIGQHVHSVRVLDADGNVSERLRADLRFGYRHSNLDDAIILDATFDLEEDNPEDLVRRVKKIWISKKANQPFEFEAAGYVFRSSRGLDAVELIERAGLRGTKVGAAELSDRNLKFIVVQPDGAARDVLRLIDLVTTKVEERLGVELELQIDVW